MSDLDVANLKWWEWMMVAGMGLLALTGSLRVMDRHLALGALIIESGKLGVLAGILATTIWKNNRPAAFLSAALVSILTDLAWSLAR